MIVEELNAQKTNSHKNRINCLEINIKVIHNTYWFRASDLLGQPREVASRFPPPAPYVSTVLICVKSWGRHWPESNVT